MLLKPNRVDQLTCWSFVCWHFCVVLSNMSVTCWPRRCPMHWLMHCWEPIPYHTHTIILIIWPWKFLLLKDAFLRYYDVWRFNVNIHICDLKAQQSQLPNVHLGTWVIKTLHTYKIHLVCFVHGPQGLHLPCGVQLHMTDLL